MSLKLPHRVFIGIGSNLDNPVAQVKQSLNTLEALPLCEIVSVSPLYRTAPVGPQDQDDFVNAAVELMTAYTPLALLDQLQRIEQQQRRVRLRHWGPRTIDLDILLYDDRKIDWPRLKVPHPELLNRAFAWKPILDIRADISLPTGQRLAEQCDLKASDKMQLIDE